MELSYPFKNFGNRRVTTDFIGEDLHKRTGLPRHEATDYGMPTGTELMAIGGAKVSEITPSDGAVYFIYTHPLDWDYIGKSIPAKGFAFVHCSEILVKKGDIVKPGQIVARSGNVGTSSGPHLHLVMYDIDDQPINPETFFGVMGAVMEIEKLKGSNSKLNNKLKNFNDLLTKFRAACSGLIPILEEKNVKIPGAKYNIPPIVFDQYETLKIELEACQKAQGGSDGTDGETAELQSRIATLEKANINLQSKKTTLEGELKKCQAAGSQKSRLSELIQKIINLLSGKDT